jgi:hypothetical protein
MAPAASMRPACLRIVLTNVVFMSGVLEATSHGDDEDEA